MLRGVGAPGAPGFSTIQEACGAGACSIENGCAAKQADVGCGEGVGFAEGAEGDVVGCPLAYAADGAEASDRVREARPNGKKRPQAQLESGDVVEEAAPRAVRELRFQATDRPRRILLRIE